MKILVKKLDKEAIIPKYQSDFASGFDIHSLQAVEISPLIKAYW